VPACRTRVCGDDGCGGMCGTCDDPSTVCSAGACVPGYDPVALLDPDRWDAAVASGDDGFVWIAGGRTVVHDPGGVIYAVGTQEVQRFNPGTALATRMEPMPELLSAPNAALLGGILWVAGGAVLPDSQGSAETASSRTIAYENGGWRTHTLAQVPAPSLGGAALAMGGKLWLFAGRGADGAPMRRVDVLDPAAGAWSSRDARPLARSHFAAATDGNRAWLAGGWDGTKTLGTVEFYDPATGWGSAGELPVPVAGAHAVVASGRMFVFGGWDGPSQELGDPKPFVQVVDLATRRTLRIGTTYESRPGGVPARVRDGSVLVFGGTDRVAQAPVARGDVVKFRVPEP